MYPRAKTVLIAEWIVAMLLTQLKQLAGY